MKIKKYLYILSSICLLTSCDVKDYKNDKQSSMKNSFIIFNNILYKNINIDENLNLKINLNFNYLDKNNQPEINDKKYKMFLNISKDNNFISLNDKSDFCNENITFLQKNMKNNFENIKFENKLVNKENINYYCQSVKDKNDLELILPYKEIKTKNTLNFIYNENYKEFINHNLNNLLIISELIGEYKEIPTLKPNYSLKNLNSIKFELFDFKNKENVTLEYFYTKQPYYFLIISANNYFNCNNLYNIGINKDLKIIKESENNLENYFNKYQNESFCYWDKNKNLIYIKNNNLNKI